MVAKTYDAKARGIRTGMPVWEARKLFPDAVCLSADFRYYGQVSGALFAILRRYSPEVEAYSIDEGFLGMDGLRSLWGKGFGAIADHMRESVRRELGVSVSVGVSVTRTLAKMASEYGKPDGSTVVPGRRIGSFLARLGLRAIPGIGGNREALLNKFGVASALDFAHARRELMQRLLGKGGVKLWLELNGESVMPLELSARTPKSMARTASLGQVTGDRRVIATHLTRHAMRLASELVAKRLLTQQVKVFLRRKSFEAVSMHVRLDCASNNDFRLSCAVRSALEALYDPECLYRACGVVAGRISREEDATMDLFGVMRADARQGELLRTVAAVNRRYGREMLTMAIGSQKWQGSRFQYPMFVAS